MREHIHRVSQSSVRCLSEQKINAISRCNEQNTLVVFGVPSHSCTIRKKGLSKLLEKCLK